MVLSPSFLEAGENRSCCWVWRQSPSCWGLWGKPTRLLGSVFQWDFSWFIFIQCHCAQYLLCSVFLIEGLSSIWLLKGFYFVLSGWKSRMWRGTWNNTQVWPWSTKQRLIRVLSREHADHSRHSFSKNPRDACIHGRHQMVNTEIRLIIFVATLEKLCTNKIWSWLISWAQIMSSLLQNSGSDWRK